jgi:hypothetical protein
MYVMKKKIIIIVLILLVIAAGIYYLTQHKSGSAGSGSVSRKISASKIYSDKDINSAMDIVEKSFSENFSGCTLADLRYEEDVSSKASAEWAEQYSADEAIVLLSDFNTASSGVDGSLNPNHFYKDWQWILVRSKGGSWELKTWGY